jgi:hypothetical protein
VKEFKQVMCWAVGILVFASSMGIGNAAVLARKQPYVEDGRLAEGPYATLQGVLKKTFFRVKVVQVEMRVDPPTQRELAAITSGKRYSPERAEQVIEAAMDADDVLVTAELKRNVPFDLYLEALYADLGRAERTGLISADAYQALAWLVPDWLEPIEDRGLRKGDRLVCRITANGLRIVYESADGKVLLDRAARGREPGRAVLAAYLAPGTNLSEMLVRSLFDPK